MKLLTPTKTEKTIYDIDYNILKKEGIKCLLFDLDNTCVGYHDKLPTKKLNNLFKKLKSIGFIVVIFSNTTKKRIKPFTETDAICHPKSLKPLSFNFKKIMKKYNLNKKEVCIIGDQLFTDVLGGNKVGIMTYLVDPLTNEDFIITRFFRKIERKILSKQKGRKK